MLLAIAHATTGLCVLTSARARGRRWFFEMKTLILNNFSIFFPRFLLPLAELKMDVLRERECKDSIERQLADERKLRGKLSILLYRARCACPRIQVEMFK